MSDRKRTWPALDPALFVASLVVYVAGTPLGLDRVGGCVEGGRDTRS